MYINIKNPARAKEQLKKLEETAQAAKSDSLNNDFLYTQANYYYTFGMNSQGDAAASAEPYITPLNAKKVKGAPSKPVRSTALPETGS